MTFFLSCENTLYDLNIQILRITSILVCALYNINIYTGLTRPGNPQPCNFLLKLFDTLSFMIKL